MCLESVNSAAAIAHVERLCQQHSQGGAGESPALPLRKVGIVGAGLMGKAVAALTVSHGIQVFMADSDPQALATLEGRIAAELGEIPRRADGQPAIVVGVDDAQLGQCDLILESIVEVLEPKQQLYARLEPHLAAGTILASNTSTIPIGRLAAKLADPARFCGVHFFHPVAQRPLLEVIHAPATARSTVAKAVGFGRQIGLMPIQIEDGPGFLVNRMTMAYIGEALELVAAGMPISQIEAAAVEFGMAIPPIRLLDEIGLDTTLRSGWVMSEAFPDRALASPILVSVIKSGRLGGKTRSGFYLYDGPNPQQPDPSIEPIIGRWIKPQPPVPHAQLADRLLLPMFLEGTRILAEGVAQTPGEVDLASMFALGFPRKRGGVLYWGDSLGAQQVIERLRPFAHLGPRMQPTALLQRMAAEGRRFYSDLE